MDCIIGSDKFGGGNLSIKGNPFLKVLKTSNITFLGYWKLIFVLSFDKYMNPGQNYWGRIIWTRINWRESAKWEHLEEDHHQNLNWSGEEHEGQNLCDWRRKCDPAVPLKIHDLIKTMSVPGHSTPLGIGTDIFCERTSS